MRIASIDIGSNTVLLLIADIVNSEIIPIINKYRIPRISSGISESGLISEESIEKLYNILSEYKSLIEQHKCEKVVLNGTQALRVAKNSASILDEIKNKFNFDLNIVTGETEALYSFKGALSSFNDNNNYVMIDIGGASTEIVFGNRNEIFYRKSFPIGAVTSKERFLKSDPPTLGELKIFENELNNIFDELQKINIDNSSIVAVAGTPTTLSALKIGMKEYSELEIEKTILTMNDFDFYISKFNKMKYREIINHYSPIIIGREDVILSGTLILRFLMKRFCKTEIYVSSRGLRYGALIA